MSSELFQWRKLLLESAAIITSILLAFAIDAAWDQSQESQDKADILESIELDMLLTLEQLGSISRQNLVAFEASRKFLTPKPESELDQSDAEYYSDITRVFFRNLYHPTDGSLSNTNISQISDLELRNAVGLWIRYSARVREQAVLLEEHLAAIRILPGAASMVLRENVRREILTPDNLIGNPQNIDVYRDLRQDPNFVTTMLHSNVHRHDYDRVVRYLQEQTELVLDLIENQ